MRPNDLPGDIAEQLDGRKLKLSEAIRIGKLLAQIAAWFWTESRESIDDRLESQGY